MTHLSPIEVALQTAHDLEFDKVTIAQMEAIAFPEVEPMHPQDIKSLRESFKVSQPVMAKILNVSDHTVKKWERGATTPDGAAMRLLNLIRDKGIGVLLQ